jgi:hypothetical protein
MTYLGQNYRFPKTVATSLALSVCNSYLINSRKSNAVLTRVTRMTIAYKTKLS